MNLADRVFRPFETLIKPLDLPITTLPDSGPLQLVWHFAKKFRQPLFVVGLLTVLSSLIGFYVVWMLAHIVDGVVANGAQAFLSSSLLLILLFGLVILLIDPLVSFIEDCFLSQTVEVLLPAAMTWQAHKSVENQDVAFFEDIYAGQVASRIQQVTRSVQRQLILSIRVIPQFVIQFIGSVGLLAFLAWPLAVPVVVWILVNIVIAWKVIPIFMQKSEKVAEATSRATGVMTDVYSNIAMVKAFSAEASEGDAIRKVMQDTIKTAHQETRYYIGSNLAVRLSNAALAVSIFAVSIWGMIDGIVSVGDFVAAATITRSLLNSSYAFIGLGQTVSQALGTIKDAMPVITTKPTVQDVPNAPVFTLKQGEIRFDNVSYAYADTAGQSNNGKDADGESKHSHKVIIDNLSLTVAPREKVGLVGLSGAGKSTLIALLLRLRDVDQGSISVDDQNVQEVTQASLRREIGVVTQDVFLLNRSIRENIKYGAPNANDAQVERAADLAEANDFIQDLKDKEGRMGLDAYVGDRGVKLSGGQRQRIAIARVILKDAGILLLDEATSALDSEAEAEIQANLEMLMRDKTTLAIAHRLSTIATMDRLVVLDKGQIVEQGTHEQLINSDGLYSKLWARQSGGFIGSTV